MKSKEKGNQPLEIDSDFYKKTRDLLFGIGISMSLGRGEKGQESDFDDLAINRAMVAQALRNNLDKTNMSYFNKKYMDCALFLYIKANRYYQDLVGKWALERSHGMEGVYDKELWRTDPYEWIDKHVVKDAIETVEDVARYIIKAQLDFEKALEQPVEKKRFEKAIDKLFDFAREKVPEKYWDKLPFLMPKPPQEHEKIKENCTEEEIRYGLDFEEVKKYMSKVAEYVDIIARDYTFGECENPSDNPKRNESIFEYVFRRTNMIPQKNPDQTTRR